MLCGAYEFPIKGFIETSFIDWKKHLASVIFSGGCNFRCPYCHNTDLVLRHTEIEDVPLEHIIVTLRKYKRWVDRVVVTGGEPTIHMNLFNVIWNIKKEGLLVKLDTNGSAPTAIKGLVSEGLVDYIAMDIKGPVDRYKRWCGVDVNTNKIKESIQFILEGKVDYEFRMTVVPFLHKEEDVYEAVEHVKAAKRFYIQEFKPNNTLNPSFSDIKPFSAEKMEKIRQNVSEMLSVRNGQGLQDEIVKDQQDESP
jgi:pyruvate formate lyase activating enzyme